VTDLGIEGGAVDSLTVETSDADGNSGATETHDVDGVVVAAMPNVLEDLTGYPCEIDFQGTVCSVWSTDQSLSDTYWLNIKDDAPFGVFIEHTDFAPRERYGGEHLYYTASYVQDPGEDLWQMSDAEVESHWQEGIGDLFPHFDPDAVNWVKTARNPRTAPIYERGYLGVYYAGMASRAQYPERSLNGGIEAGFACADLIADDR
jgi:protoporphyrinogen oxidase